MAKDLAEFSTESKRSTRVSFLSGRVRVLISKGKGLGVGYKKNWRRD